MDSGPRSRRLRQDIVLPLSAERARAQLIQLFALETGRRRVELTVGPSRTGHLPSSRVSGVIAGPRPMMTTDAFSMRWKPLGRASRALPDLDADVGVTPIDQTACLLSIVARYTVPFRGGGVVADRAVMTRVADATLAALLHEWAGAITGSGTTSPVYPSGA